MADISGLNKTALEFYNSAVNGIYKSNSNIDTNETEGYSDSFSKILSSAMDMVKETDSLAAAAEEAEINFSLGNAESTHEVTIAQQKAYLSLQYTVAVKNALLSAYKEIMNIQV